ncbi:related to UGA4-GABA permease-also involved in delta-aminolevulinate transport [Armillaria ostoyae]|uniref:Related to UGA4-GABA permease-also involved in delta-aminolevulinate transport n=1 Tax=Armillaria ostoyae TaxID=47428 RepID=A0A284QWG2_ARMOS|nr:related to UGA4-GABA permease-also involved in delta-aminolevulinate transport [Armillaria ostoyae]
MLQEKDNNTETVSLSTVDTDERLLTRLGYKQELKRHFTPLEIFGFAFSLIGIVPSFTSVFIYSISNGGAFAMIWGWAVCSIFIAAITLATADLASAAPTSGGLYYWTFMFSSEKWRCFLCWIVGCLPVATPKEFRNDAKFALEDFTNVSGWPNGFAFILSFLTPLWSVGIYDAPVHMSEEATNASIAVPMAIIFSIFSVTILGWAMNISLVFCMGRNYQSIIDSPIGQPMATILFNSFGKTGTLVVWSFVILTQFAISLNQMMTSSRQIFAFSRDGGLPLSRWVYYVDPQTRIPTHAIWFGTCWSIILGCLAFAGNNAIGAVFSLGVTGQYVSFCIPMSARFLGGKTIKPGPFRLGRLSLPITAIAVTWMTFMTVVFMFPLTPSPGVDNMNYTVTDFSGGVLILATVYFYFPKYGGINWFTGPVSTVEAPAVQVKNDAAEKE